MPMVYRGVYHEHVIQTGMSDMLEDKIFHVLGATHPYGELIVSFDGGENLWLSARELTQKEKRYVSCDIETRIGMGKERFIEAVQVYTKEEF